MDTDKNIVKKMETIQTMIETLGIEDNNEEIPVPAVTGDVLSKISQWIEYHMNKIQNIRLPDVTDDDIENLNNPLLKTFCHSPDPESQRESLREIKEIQRNGTFIMRPHEFDSVVSHWRQEYFDVGLEKLFDIIIGADYLDVKFLLNRACNFVMDKHSQGKIAQILKK